MRKHATALVLGVGLILCGPGPASAHTGHDLGRWLQAWEAASLAPDLSPAVTFALAVELAEMTERHPWYFDPAWEPPQTPGSSEPSPAPEVSAGNGSGVEQWRGLVAAHFRAADVDRALCLMGHESGGNPSARNPSGAGGLFQVMPFWFEKYGGAWDDPENNTRVARLVLDEQGWGAWSPYNRGLCH